MTYSDFATFDDLRANLGVIVTAAYGTYATAPPSAPSAWLIETLERGRLKATRSNTEKARSEWLITPVLTELEDSLPQIAVFSGRPLRSSDLSGVPDFLVASAHGGKAIEHPTLPVVEAKRDDFEYGAAQCIAAMRAAHNINADDAPVGGAITNGTSWQFLDLVDATTATLDEQIYTLEDMPIILGVLRYFCTRRAIA
ncbi:MAG: hypothetical protein MUD01_06185 [Chloroflexaceae bacterium]|jgi:hypothetical protein|nr:hypothetical protein [Chloroflexaceae bacterium]